MTRGIRTGPEGYAIECQAIEKRFGADHVLRGASLEVAPGTFHLLAGPNGAGKSTLIKILLDLVRADRGDAHVLGMDSVRHAGRLRAVVGYVPDGGLIPHPGLSVADRLAFHARHYEHWDRAYAERLLRALAVPLDRTGRKLSQSESLRVNLVAALAHRPPVLLLDEPLAGFDPATHDLVLSLLADHLADRPATVLVATQDVVAMSSLIDHAALLRDGRILPLGSVEALAERLKRYRVRIVGPWRPQPALLQAAIEHNEGGRESEWVVWGDEAWVASAFSAAGAEITEVLELSPLDAITTLLRSASAIDVH